MWYFAVVISTHTFHINQHHQVSLQVLPTGGRVGNVLLPLADSNYLGSRQLQMTLIPQSLTKVGAGGPFGGDLSEDSSGFR